MGGVAAGKRIGAHHMGNKLTCLFVWNGEVLEDIRWTHGAD